MSNKVLLVDDDAAVREALGQTLELANLSCISAGSFIVAKDHITPDFAGVILSDMRMPGRDGFHLLAYAQKVDPDLPVILLTGEGDIAMAVQAMGKGAFGFLAKPCAPQELLAVLERALKTRALVLENRHLKTLVETGDPAARMIFGDSDLARQLRARVRRVALTEAEVLVTGPPGSGISKVAEVIHLSSARSKAQFVKLAAAGLSVAAFTEGVARAKGGSVFFDEVSQMPPQTQMALAEVLDGASGARLIVGSTRALSGAVEAGVLSSDLFYRLDGMQVRIPSLAERPEDIAVLFRRYVAQAAEQSGLRAPEITPQVVSGLMARDWPGNARSLMSAAMRFVMGLAEDAPTDPTLGLGEQLAQVEKSLIEAALRRAGGQATAAAAALKLPRKTFYDRCARYHIKPESFRD